MGGSLEAAACSNGEWVPWFVFFMNLNVEVQRRDDEGRVLILGALAVSDGAFPELGRQTLPEYRDVRKATCRRQC